VRPSPRKINTFHLYYFVLLINCVLKSNEVAPMRDERKVVQKEEATVRISQPNNHHGQRSLVSYYQISSLMYSSCLSLLHTHTQTSNHLQ